jgi:hypothetical protein
MGIHEDGTMLQSVHRARTHAQIHTRYSGTSNEQHYYYLHICCPATFKMTERSETYYTARHILLQFRTLDSKGINTVVDSGCLSRRHITWKQLDTSQGHSIPWRVGFSLVRPIPGTTPTSNGRPEEACRRQASSDASLPTNRRRPADLWAHALSGSQTPTYLRDVPTPACYGTHYKRRCDPSHEYDCLTESSAVKTVARSATGRCTGSNRKGACPFLPAAKKGPSSPSKRNTFSWFLKVF